MTFLLVLPIVLFGLSIGFSVASLFVDPYDSETYLFTGIMLLSMGALLCLAWLALQ